VTLFVLSHGYVRSVPLASLQRYETELVAFLAALPSPTDSHGA
jgi:hypothetical protein